MKRQLVAGIGWVTIGRILRETIQIVVGILLARLLTPADFGLMAMALVFARFAWIFSELGLAGAIVQRKVITEAHLSSIFWINLAFGILVSLLFIAASPIIANFYNEPDLVPIIIIVSSTIAIGALNDVQQALMRRHMSFQRYAIADVSSIVVAGGVAIGMALAGFGVWSLAMQSVLVMTINVVVMWFLSDWRPHLLFDIEAVRDIMRFSLNLQGAQVTEYLVQNGDNLLLGRFVGTYAVGIFQIASRYMLAATSLIVPIFGTVMVSGFSRVQDDHQRLRLIYIRTTQVILFLTMPLSVGLIVVADSFVLALLGAKWIDVIPLLRIMGFAAIWLPLIRSRRWLLISLGRTELLFRWQVIEGVMAVFSLLIGVQFGIQGVALAFVVRTWLLLYPLVAIPGALIGLSFGAFMHKMLPILLVSAAMALSVWLATMMLFASFTPLYRLVVQAVFGGLVYVGLAFALRLEVMQELIRILGEVRSGVVSLSGN
jgi:O-antigen/teichoic acid export membrane protein